MDGKTDIEKLPSSATNDDEAGVAIGEIVNVSGHVQELDRNFGFWSICAVSIVADNAWAAGGGSLVRHLSSTAGSLYQTISS
jgi:choline transport protein